MVTNDTCPVCDSEPGEATFSTSPNQAVCPGHCPINTWDPTIPHSHDSPSERDVVQVSFAAGVASGVFLVVALLLFHWGEYGAGVACMIFPLFLHFLLFVYLFLGDTSDQ